jgi:hypothetical protein
MKPQDDAPLEAHLLFRPGATQPQATAFAGKMAEALRRFDLPLVAEGQNDAGELLFTNPRFRLTLKYHHDPCPPETLIAALQAPVLALKPGDLRRQAADHAQHLTVSVTPKAQGTASLQGPLPWHMRLVVLHRAILALFDLSEAEMLHFPLSDMLFARSEVLETRDATLPLPLCLHPLPIAPPDVPTIAGVLPPLGFVALGSERFCGKPVVLAPSPVPLREGITLVAALLRDHAGGVLTLDDGRELRNPSHGGVFIRHTAPDEGAPDGRILIGLGDWPPETAVHGRPLLLDELLPGHAGTVRKGKPAPGFLGQIGRALLTPNGMMIVGALIVYVVVSHLAAAWIEGQSEMIRSSLQENIQRTSAD